MPKRLFSLVLAVGLTLAIALSASAEPVNLSTLKQEITAYVASGEYGRQVTAVAKQANEYIIKRIKKGAKDGKKLAIVFDIDETTLSNVRHIQSQDYGYLPKVWDAWITEGHATAVYPIQGVYDTAIHSGIDVFFITARPPTAAAATERNLREVGYEKWAAIYYKPEKFEQGTRAFKIDTRRQLATQGYVIIANVGDQDSDLLGGFAERTFKLPNPFYLAN